MKPSKLLRHTETTHPALKARPLEFLKAANMNVKNRQVSKDTTAPEASH